MRSDVVKGDRPVNYLLVEGDDDEHVFYSLLEHHKIPDLFEIKNKKGIDKLLGDLDVELEDSRLARLGIVVDADTDLAARWQALRNILNRFGYSTLPIVPELSGTIIEQDELPIVGIWLMPNNKISGMLEDFVSFLVPLGDLLWPMAEDVVQKVIEKDCRFRETYQSKACLHTWLAWQKEPGKPMGLAITAHYLDANAPHAQELVGWIRKLFDLGSA